MVATFPEEIIHQILKQLFDINIRDVFIQSHSATLWDFYDERLLEWPPCRLALVSKQWRRIATPLIYTTVHLSTDAGVQHLASTLAKKPSLGPLIKHLRLDGGYGQHLQAVIKSAPNVQVISLNLKVSSRTSVSGLLRSLPSLNPTELYLHDATWFQQENKKGLAIIEALPQAIKGWNSLRSLCFSSCILAGTTRMIQNVTRALNSAPALSEATFESTDLGRLLFDATFCQAVSQAGLRRIRCLGADGCLGWNPGWETVPEEIKVLIVYEAATEKVDWNKIIAMAESTSDKDDGDNDQLE